MTVPTTPAPETVKMLVRALGDACVNGSADMECGEIAVGNMGEHVCFDPDKLAATVDAYYAARHAAEIAAVSGSKVVVNKGDGSPDWPATVRLRASLTAEYIRQLEAKLEAAQSAAAAPTSHRLSTGWVMDLLNSAFADVEGAAQEAYWDWSPEKRAAFADMVQDNFLHEWAALNAPEPPEPFRLTVGECDGREYPTGQEPDHGPGMLAMMRANAPAEAEAPSTFQLSAAHRELLDKTPELEVHTLANSKTEFSFQRFAARFGKRGGRC